MLTSPSGKVYIGQTIRPIRVRFNEHKKSNDCVVLYNAIKKYGWDKFKTDWYECPDEDLDFDETFLIDEMKTLIPNGYNIREGGSKGKLSEETKQKIRKANMGNIHTDETKQKIRKANMGKTYSDETIQKMSKSKQGEKHPNYGKTRSDKTKQKISAKLIGRILSEDTKQKLSGKNHYKSKRVYQFDLEGNFLQSFDSCREAAQYIKKKDHQSISKCINGVRISAYGFKWYSEMIKF